MAAVDSISINWCMPFGDPAQCEIALSDTMINRLDHLGMKSACFDQRLLSPRLFRIHPNLHSRYNMVSVHPMHKVTSVHLFM